MNPTASLSFRLATLEDAELLFRWRNDNDTRANSRETAPVPWQSHLRWLEAKLRDDLCDVLIAEKDGESVGTVRIEVRNDETELSWTVAPEQRGRGIGRGIVRCAAGLRPGRLVAYIHPDTASSETIARGAGFVPVGTEDGFRKWLRDVTMSPMTS